VAARSAAVRLTRAPGPERLPLAKRAEGWTWLTLTHGIIGDSRLEVVLATTTHRLKVTLRRVRPPVWRRIEVPSNITMFELSAVLEAAMGWFGGHLHSFEAGGVRYELPDSDSSGLYQMVDERNAKLRQVLPAVKSKLRWDYDFGDGWEHDVIVEAIEPTRSEATYPVCLKGKRACPPEDCGGPWGYENLLDALRDPEHPEHDVLADWASPDFDSEEFDVEITTAMMRVAKPFEW
jgi:hypothetical protein